jgi:hypothetical protein
MAPDPDEVAAALGVSGEEPIDAEVFVGAHVTVCGVSAEIVRLPAA